MTVDNRQPAAGESTLGDDLRSVIEASIDPVLLLDRQQRVRAFNTAALDLFGYSAVEMVLKPFIELLPSRTHADYRLCLQSCADCNPSKACAPQFIRCVTRSGREFDAEVSRSLDKGATWRATTIVLRDITSRLTARKHNAHRIALVSTLADAVISVDQHGIVETWNEAAERMTGYAASLAVESHFEDLGLFDDCPLRQARLADAPVRTEGFMNLGEGKKLAVSVTSTPVRGPDQKFLGVSAIVSDITERKKREEHMRFVMMELSHRAKNLMSVIVSMAQCTAENCASMPDFERKFSARMHSLAHSHDLLLKENWAGAKVRDLFEKQLNSFADCTSERTVIKGPSITLRPQAAQMLGLAIHELGTNAAKYGALSEPSGRLEIAWSVPESAESGARLVIDWIERVTRPVSQPAREGFGLMVITDMVASTLDAEVTIQFAPEGLHWRLEAKPTYWHFNE